MSKINVRHDHELSPEEARQRIDAFESYMGKYGARLDWKGSEAALKGPGVSGDVVLGDRFVAITIKLGMLARAAGVDPKRLEGSIKRRLEETFAKEPPA